MKHLEQVVNHLSDMNNIHPPQLRLANKGGYYRPTNETIYVPIHLLAHNRLKVATDFLLHEFTHHLFYIENGIWKQKEEIHGVTFTKLLIENVQKHYGDILQYPWQTEYQKVRDVMEMLPK